MRRTRNIWALAATAAWIAAAAPLAATTYVLPPDGALVDQAPLIAQVSIAAVEPSPIPGPPSTDYFVQIERVLKGYVTGGTLVVRVPGGIGPDGVGLRIWGAPQFREAERALLFLAPRGDGTYGLLHLMLGAFYELESGGRRVAVRALAEAVEVTGLGGGRLEGIEPARDFAAFVEWIRGRAEGENRPVDYLLPHPARVARPLMERAGLLEDRCTAATFRWPGGDARAGRVQWQVDRRGFDGAGSGRRSFERARKLWAEELETPRLGRSVLGRSRAGFSTFDDLNTLLFNDPNDVVSGEFRCASGGLVSLSGVWFDNGRGQSCERVGAGRKLRAGGRAHLEILGGDIVTNDGTACLFRRDAPTTTEVLAHELGHTLGLSHALSDDELMWGEVRDRQSAKPLGDGDRRELSRLYPAPSRERERRR